MFIQSVILEPSLIYVTTSPILHGPSSPLYKSIFWHRTPACGDQHSWIIRAIPSSCHGVLPPARRHRRKYLKRRRSSILEGSSQEWVSPIHCEILARYLRRTHGILPLYWLPQLQASQLSYHTCRMFHSVPAVECTLSARVSDIGLLFGEQMGRRLAEEQASFDPRSDLRVRHSASLPKPQCHLDTRAARACYYCNIPS